MTKFRGATSSKPCSISFQEECSLFCTTLTWSRRLNLRKNCYLPKAFLLVTDGFSSKIPYQSLKCLLLLFPCFICLLQMKVCSVKGGALLEEEVETSWCWLSTFPGTWVWVDSGSWWWTGRPGVLWFMGSQRVGHNWVTELNWCKVVLLENISFPWRTVKIRWIVSKKNWLLVAGRISGRSSEEWKAKAISKMETVLVIAPNTYWPFTVWLTPF